MPVDTILSGSTGLVGSNILSTLLARQSISAVSAFARRTLSQTTSPKLHPLVSTDIASWPSLVPQATVFFSALGTTRGQAGSFEAQRKIDHDLPLSLAEAYASRPSTGKKIFVLISSGGASSNSWFPYTKMKGETEDAIRKLLKSGDDAQEQGLDHVIIVRAGIILGTREDSRPPEYAVRQIAKAARVVSTSLADIMAQDAQVIARAAVHAAELVLDDKVKDKTWIIGSQDIVRLGRTEWS